MNIFKKMPLDWWQVGLLKIALLAIGVAIGATWPLVFAPYALTFFIIGIVLGIYVAFVWFK